MSGPWLTHKREDRHKNSSSQNREDREEHERHSKEVQELQVSTNVCNVCGISTYNSRVESHRLEDDKLARTESGYNPAKETRCSRGLLEVWPVCWSWRKVFGCQHCDYFASYL